MSKQNGAGPPPIALAIFETRIEGRLARVELECSPDALTSREARSGLADLARIAFGNLSPKFDRKQKIKCVEIVLVKPPEPGEGGNE